MKRGCFDNLLFVVILAIALAGSTYFWFNFFVRGKSLPTPNLIGKSVADARAVCSDLGVSLNLDSNTRRNSDKVPSGYVVWQNRTPGTTSLIKRGTNIRVELSAGPLVLHVPDLRAESGGTAVLRLSQLNLRLGSLTYADVPQAVVSMILATLKPGHDAAGQTAVPEQPREPILAADPPIGTVVAAQSPVAFLVASPTPPPSYVMPDLIDHSLDEVRPYLEGHSLKISTVKFEEYPGIADGIIIRQFPTRGSAVSARDAITVVVSKQDTTSITQQPPPPRPLLGAKTATQ